MNGQGAPCATMARRRLVTSLPLFLDPFKFPTRWSKPLGYICLSPTNPTGDPLPQYAMCGDKCIDSLTSCCTTDLSLGKICVSTELCVSDGVACTSSALGCPGAMRTGRLVFAWQHCTALRPLLTNTRQLPRSPWAPPCRRHAAVRPSGRRRHLLQPHDAVLCRSKQRDAGRPAERRLLLRQNVLQDLVEVGPPPHRHHRSFG